MATATKLISGETIFISGTQAWVVRNYGKINEKAKEIPVKKALQLIKEKGGV